MFEEKFNEPRPQKLTVLLLLKNSFTQQSWIGFQGVFYRSICVTIVIWQFVDFSCNELCRKDGDLKVYGKRLPVQLESLIYCITCRFWFVPGSWQHFYVSMPVVWGNTNIVRQIAFSNYVFFIVISLPSTEWNTVFGTRGSAVECRIEMSLKYQFRLWNVL